MIINIINWIMHNGLISISFSSAKRVIVHLVKGIEGAYGYYRAKMMEMKIRYFIRKSKSLNEHPVVQFSKFSQLAQLFIMYCQFHDATHDFLINSVSGNDCHLQAITVTDADVLPIEPIGANFNRI